MNGLNKSNSVLRIAVTFEKRDWGSGKETWRERPDRHKLVGPSRYAARRLSNRQAKRRMLSGDVLQVYGTSIRRSGRV